jgi:hypothetical protein
MTEFSLSLSQLHNSNKKQKFRGTQTIFSCISRRNAENLDHASKMEGPFCNIEECFFIQC